jgi:type I restriction enzyme S subunit
MSDKYIIDEKLGNITQIEMGQSPDSRFYKSEDIGLPLIQGNADIKDRKSIKRIWTTHITKQCDAGDILMTVRAPVGFIGIAKYDSCIGRGVCSIKAKDIDSEYLYQLLIFNENKWNALEQGSTFTAVGSKEIYNFPLQVVNSNIIQRKIATILSTADAVIEKTQAAIAKYKAIKQGMLQDLFTRGIDTTTGKLRPSYQDEPELYKESKLGWIPKEWEEERLGNRAVIEYGKSQKAVVSINGNIPVYGTGGLMEYATDFLFDGESILIGRKGTIDKPFYINGKFWTVDTAYYLSSFSGNVRWLHSQLEFYNLKRLNEATGVPSINREQLYNILLSFPEPKEQNEIVKRILSIDKKLQTEQDFLHKQQQIKAGLMNDLLSGKKKVIVKKELETQTENN